MTNTNIDLTRPIRLEASRAWRTYIGGKMISALHGTVEDDTSFPEEWLMSTVLARNAGRETIVEGVSHVYGTDITLKDLVLENAEAILGAHHVAKYGDSLGVLVKLLDAAERLTLQVHPTRETAKRLFDSAFGKTECWHIIGEREINGEKPCIYIGFKEGVSREKWKHCFDTQDIPAMLDCLHKVEVKTGDTFIIRGGVPHGIGAGCFLVEIQEPTDYTLRTERVTPSGLKIADRMCHQGLGFERMFDCFEYDGASLSETLSRYRVAPKTEAHGGYTVTHIIYPEVTDMFALDLITVTDTVSLSGSGRFYGIYVLDGEGIFDRNTVKTCDHYIVPASAGDITVTGSEEAPLRLLRFFGPKE